MVGALSQALKIQGAATDAASTTPAATAALDEVKRASTANREAAAKMAANTAQVEKLVNEPAPPMPSVPRLAPLPQKEVIPPKDPLRVFGQVMPVLAALSALTTRQPAVNALNAATAAITAAKAKDKEALETAHRDWVENLKLTVANNDRLVGEYKMALEDRNIPIAERMAKANAIAALNRDYVAQAALAAGNPDGFMKLLQVLQTGGAQLSNLALSVEQNDIERQKAQAQQAQRWAELEIDRRRLDRFGMGDAIGPLLAKMASGQPMTADELKAIEAYKSITEGQRRPSMLDPAALAAMGVQPPAPATPGQNGAQAATAAAVTAAPAAPVATAAPPPVAPQNPKDRVVDKVYSTPQGPLLWKGAGWARPPGG